MAMLGFGWFLLITMASYTANLAAILLSDNIVYDVQGMQDVLDRQLTICVVPQIQPEFVSLYPTAKTKALESSSAIYRGLYTGECDVALDAASAFTSAASGLYNVEDCKKIDDGMTDEAAQDVNNGAVCVKDADGEVDKTRDCSRYLKIGGPILKVPLSFPVSARMEQSFSWSIRQLQSEGEYHRIYQEELLRTSQKTVSACSTEDEEEELAMNLAGMAGTFITAMIVQVVALILGGLEYFTGRTIQDWLGMYDHYLKKDEELENTHHLTRAEFDKEVNELRKMLRLPTVKAPEPSGNDVKDGKPADGKPATPAMSSAPIPMTFSPGAFGMMAMPMGGAVPQPHPFNNGHGSLGFAYPPF